MARRSTARETFDRRCSFQPRLFLEIRSSSSGRCASAPIASRTANSSSGFSVTASATSMICSIVSRLKLCSNSRMNACCRASLRFIVVPPFLLKYQSFFPPGRRKMPPTSCGGHFILSSVRVRGREWIVKLPRLPL